MAAIQQPIRGATLSKMATLQPMAAAAQATSVASAPKPSVFKKSATILYSTGRSVSIATASLEPQYPWDYDLDNDLDDDGLDDYDDDEDEDLAGERYMINGEEEEYQHPSLETSKPIFLNSLAR